MSADAKFVTVTAKVGNVVIPINSITFRHTINSLPMIEFTTQLSNHGTNGDTGIELAEFQKLNVITQQKFYNRFSLEPDTVIEAIDGDNNTLRFVGFLMQPTMRIVSGQINLTFSAVHIGAAFQVFCGSVYNTTPTFYLSSDFGRYFAGIETEDLGPPGLLSQLEDLPALNATDYDWDTLFGRTHQSADLFSNSEQPRTDSVAQRIFAILNGLHQDAIKAVSNPAISPEIREVLNVSVLNANSAVLPYIRHFLMGSLRTTIISGLTAMGTDATMGIPSDAPLHQTIFDIFSSAPNFLMAALNYINPFLFQLNATWDGRLALEPNQFIKPPGNRKIQAAIEDISFSLAAAHELPLAQVVVLYPTEEFYVYGGNMGTDQIPMELLGAAMDNNPGANAQPQNINSSLIYAISTGFENLSFSGDTLRYLAAYPEKPIIKAGRYLTVVAPSWTCPTSYTAKDLLNANTENQSRFTAALSNVNKASTNLNSLQVSRVPILNYIAKTTYESCVLERTNAFVTIPLCLKVQTGRTYNLMSISGEPLYQGYLRGVTHTILLGETGAMATTALDFSHIIVNGAKLDGINTFPTTGLVDDVIRPIAVSNLA